MMLKDSTKWKVCGYTRSVIVSTIVEASDRSEAVRRGKASIKHRSKGVKFDKWTSQRVYEI